MEDLIGVPDMLLKVPYIHSFRVIKDSFVTDGLSVVEICLLCLLLQVGFLVSIVVRMF